MPTCWKPVRQGLGIRGVTTRSPPKMLPARSDTWSEQPVAELHVCDYSIGSPAYRPRQRAVHVVAVLNPSGMCNP